MQATMKFLFSMIVFSTATTSALAFENAFEIFEKPITISGRFQLVKTSTEHAAKYKCDSQIEVVVGNDEVRLQGLSAIPKSFELFKFSNLGCASGTCTYFKESWVGSTSRVPVSWVGVARKAKMIRTGYFDENTLYYTSDYTRIPLGAVGALKNENFRCEYRRMK